MRIFFIPGLGEEASIFEKIHPYMTGEKVFIDNWSLLHHVPEKNLDALMYGRYLVARFRIKTEDVVIGHSLGGWICLYVKHLVGCKVIQIASWTDKRKMLKVPLERHLIYWLAKRGFALNKITLHLLVLFHYRNKPSKEIFISIFKRLMTGNKEIIAKKLMIIFNPVKEKAAVSPDLRIHSKTDRIVKYPDQPFYEVPGDHFTLYTFPESVVKPIVEFLHNDGRQISLKK